VDVLKQSTHILPGNEWIVIERRAKPRIECDCSALVHGYRAGHKLLKARGKISNLSAGGLYLRLEEKVETDQSLLIVFSFSPLQQPIFRAPNIAARGQIVRTEPQTDGTYGMGVRLLQHRFL